MSGRGKHQNRRPETLFGGGQRNANMNGRGKSAAKTMREIAQEKIPVGCRDGKPVFKTVEEIRLRKLVALALTGDAAAIGEVLGLYHDESCKAVERAAKRRPQMTAAQRKKYPETLSAARWLVSRFSRPISELKARGMVMPRANALPDLAGQYRGYPLAPAVVATARARHAAGAS